MTAPGAVWRAQLTPAERAALGRADPEVAGSRPDVLVVGGGIMGVATAAACVAAGIGSVLLIETGRLGAGATGGATGLLIPEPHQWSDPSRSSTWSGPAWNAGGTWSGRCPAGSAWSTWTGWGWPRMRAGSPRTSPGPCSGSTPGRSMR